MTGTARRPWEISHYVLLSIATLSEWLQRKGLM
jgi:hypothetical protein